jgi:hypothetical protein
MSIFEAALFLCLAAEDFVVAVRVEWRVDVNEIDAFSGELSKLIEIIAAVNDSRVNYDGCFRLGHFA